MPRRLPPISLTVRLLVVLVALSTCIAIVTLIARHGLSRTHEAVTRLSDVQLEQLLTATRLMQQAQLVSNYARLVAQTSHPEERRLNMVELTDRMRWVDKLVREMSEGPTPSPEAAQLNHTHQQLNRQVQDLSSAVFGQHAPHPAQDARIAALASANGELSTALSLQASHASADLRRQLNDQAQALNREVLAQEQRLSWLVGFLLLAVVLAGVYIDAAVARRITGLQRQVESDEAANPGADVHGDEIARLAASIASYRHRLSEQTQAAQRAVRAKNRFLAGASHDLRQPMQALNLFLETLRSAGLNASQRQILEHARAASTASREMLDTLLDYSRLEAGVLAPRLQPVALAPVLRQLEQEHGPQADSLGLLFRVRDCDDQVHTDPALLAMIFRNLVANALRYTPRGGVLIGVRRRSAQRVVEVWDTGIGIAAHHHDMIFQEFRQVNEDAGAQGKGLGLGLAIVRELAGMLGAPVSVHSCPGRGSVFRVSLPAAPGRVVAPAPTARPGGSPSESQALQPLPGLRMLVVDDDALVRESLGAVLRQWACDVRLAASLPEAQQHLRADAPALDVVLTDFRLSAHTTGGEVIEWARGEQAKRLDGAALPAFLILTGDTAPERLQQASGLGAALLHKPLDAAMLNSQLWPIWRARCAPA